VHDIFAIIDAEGNEAASQAETKDEKTNAKQPAKTTSLINCCCGDSRMARGANAHHRRGTKSDGLNRNNGGNRLGNGSGSDIRNGLRGGSSITYRLSGGHSRCIGV